MANDYSNLHDPSELDDTELRDLVREQLAEQQGLDIDDITVRASDGHVTLSGRVGTDGELRVADHVLSDVLGLTEYTNDIFVDPIRRAESPLDMDEHLDDEEARSGTLLGDIAVPLTDESAHLADMVNDDEAGTADYQKVMEDGMTWNPPTGPTPEGMDADMGDRGEAH